MKGDDLSILGSINKLYGNSDSKKRGKCPLTLKLAIKQRWWGDSYIGECFCCGRQGLHYEDADAGHIRAASKGGEWSPENNRLICRSCNGGMRTTNMKVYMKRNYPERFKKFFPEEVAKIEEKANNKKKKSKKRHLYIMGIRVD